MFQFIYSIFYFSLAYLHGIYPSMGFHNFHLTLPAFEPRTFRSTRKWTNYLPWRGQRISQLDWRPFQSHNLLHSQGTNFCFGWKPLSEQCIDIFMKHRSPYTYIHHVFSWLYLFLLILYVFFHFLSFLDIIIWCVFAIFIPIRMYTMFFIMVSVPLKGQVKFILLASLCCGVREKFHKAFFSFANILKKKRG